MKPRTKQARTSSAFVFYRTDSGHIYLDSLRDQRRKTRECLDEWCAYAHWLPRSLFKIIKVKVVPMEDK